MTPTAQKYGFSKSASRTVEGSQGSAELKPYKPHCDKIEINRIYFIFIFIFKRIFWRNSDNC